MERFFHQLFTLGHLNVGLANQLSKHDMVGTVERSGDMVYRWCYFEINLFGDPHTALNVSLVDTYYVNDDVTGEPGSLCTAAGNDANDGMSPATPKRHIQNLLDAYPFVGVGKAIWADPGTYRENITIGSSHSGLTLQGAGWDVTTVDGGGGGGCLTLTDFASGTICSLTLQNGSAPLGGGIYAVGSSALITDCRITDNYASQHGGGIYLEDCYAEVSQCYVVGNAAGRYGGGVATTLAGSMSKGELTLVNTLLARNEAGLGAGGVLYHRAGGLIGACTVADNTASGGAGGVYCAASSPQIGNCILWDNTPQDLLGRQAKFSDVGTGAIAGPGNISLDPQFVDGGLGAEHGYYDLSSGSPCIGAAYSAPPAPATDILGNSRSVPYDMGAYEYQAPPPATLSLGMQREDGTAIVGQGLVLTPVKTDVVQVLITEDEPIEVTLPAGDVALLEAPESVLDDGEAATFSHWQVDGEEQEMGAAAIEVEMTDNREALAIYRSGLD
jgi:hypothetical protein